MNKVKRFDFLEDLRNLIDYNLASFPLFSDALQKLMNQFVVPHQLLQTGTENLMR